jgi:hypothetical protein
MNEYKITIKGKNESFKSPYTHEEAVERCVELVRQRIIRSDWIADICQQHTAGKGLSFRQIIWLHFYVARFDPIVKDLNRPEPTGETVNLVKVIALLEFARQHGEIKFPKLRLRTEKGTHLKIGLCGINSRHPGWGNLVNKGTDEKPDDKFLGYIQRNGITPAKQWSEDIMECLLAVCDDPVKAATLYGSRTGNCCFCGRCLTHKNSIALGYGPICAEKWGLFHDYARGAVEGADDHAKPTEVLQAAIDPDEAEMMRMEAEGDREQTLREETAKAEWKRRAESAKWDERDADGKPNWDEYEDPPTHVYEVGERVTLQPICENDVDSDEQWAGVLDVAESLGKNAPGLAQHTMNDLAGKSGTIKSIDEEEYMVHVDDLGFEIAFRDGEIRPA